MKFIQDLILPLIGGLGIFLYGMNLMSNNLQQIAGDKLKKIINSMSTNTLMGIFAGTSLTAVIQSSSVTTVMVVGFINASLMNLSQGINIILGANIGTTITGWILVLKIGKYGLPIVGIAAFLILFSKSRKLKKIAMVILGFGFIFLGLEFMKNGLSPLKDDPNFLKFFNMYDATSYSGLLLSALAGALLTAVLQSSSATVGITMAMASQGLINIETAVALVLGENIGTTITAFLASIGSKSEAKKAAYGHFLIKLTGVVIILPLFYQYNSFLKLFADPNKPVKFIAIAHTIFNVANALLFIGLKKYLILFLNKIVKEDESHDSTKLENSMAKLPFAVIERARLQVNQMNSTFLEAFSCYITILEKGEVPSENPLFQAERELDEINSNINFSLTQLLKNSDSDSILEDVRALIYISDQYESLGDYGASLAKFHNKIKRNDLTIHPRKLKELKKIHRLLTSSLEEIQKFHKTHDKSNLVTLLKRSELINKEISLDLTIDKGIEHILYTDILAKLRRINRHILFILNKYMEMK